MNERLANTYGGFSPREMDLFNAYGGWRKQLIRCPGLMFDSTQTRWSGAVQQRKENSEPRPAHRSLSPRRRKAG